MKRVCMITISFIFVVLVAHTSFARDDWEYWNETVAEHSLTDKLNLYMAFEQKLMSDFGNLYCYNFQPGIEYKLFPWLSLGVHYQFEHEKDGNDWARENRLKLQSTFKWSLATFHFSDRNRFEYRNIDRKESWRYRNRFKVAREMSIGNFDFEFFTSEEFFYDMRRKKLNQNRLAAGIAKKVTDFMCVELYYMVNSKRSKAHWDEAHVIGTEVGLSFCDMCRCIRDIF